MFRSSFHVLNKKLIIITGSANPHGIGSHLVSRFLDNGNNNNQSHNHLITTCDIQPFDRKQIASWVEKTNGDDRLFINSNCDVSSEDSVKQFYEQLNEYFTKEVIKNEVNSFCLINNAAIADPYMPSDDNNAEFEKQVLTTPGGEEHPPPPISMLNTNSLEQFLKVNVLGPALMMKYLCRTVLPIGKKLDDVSIINMSSTRAMMSEPHSEGYAASKSALEGLTHATAITNAPTNAQRIRVNAVRLGWINCVPPVIDDNNSESEGKIVDPFSNEAAKLEEMQPKQRDHEFHPAGRVGTPEDVFGVCEFLSDGKKSGFLTGQTITVDGGVTKKMIYPE